jgi:hypothetical protein
MKDLVLAHYIEQTSIEGLARVGLSLYIRVIRLQLSVGIHNEGTCTYILAGTCLYGILYYNDFWEVLVFERSFNSFLAHNPQLR